MSLVEQAELMAETALANVGHLSQARLVPVATQAPGRISVESLPGVGILAAERPGRLAPGAGGVPIGEDFQSSTALFQRRTDAWVEHRWQQFLGDSAGVRRRRRTTAAPVYRTAGAGDRPGAGYTLGEGCSEEARYPLPFGRHLPVTRQLQRLPRVLP
mgnify:CR=1 FL=1